MGVLSDRVKNVLAHPPADLNGIQSPAIVLEVTLVRNVEAYEACCPVIQLGDAITPQLTSYLAGRSKRAKESSRVVSKSRSSGMASWASSSLGGLRLGKHLLQGAKMHPQ